MRFCGVLLRDTGAGRVGQLFPRGAACRGAGQRLFLRGRTADGMEWRPQIAVRDGEDVSPPRHSAADHAAHSTLRRP